MADIGLRQKLLVKDVMTSPAGVVLESATANKVAALMDKDAYGCIIVTTKDGKPIGIITERDLVVRVLAKNKKPDTVKANKVMTAPVMTIEPDVTISEAARRMSRLDIRRLAVMYKEKLVGIVSSKDILGVMPELLETLQEKALIEGENLAEEAKEEAAPLAGNCDHCGVWSDDLKEIDGQFYCEDCRVELEAEE
jgi:signal-transduction protein with cAMP-binding, CBS, and nucleotidyltransferase domain